MADKSSGTTIQYSRRRTSMTVGGLDQPEQPPQIGLEPTTGRQRCHQRAVLGVHFGAQNRARIAHKIENTEKSGHINLRKTPLTLLLAGFWGKPPTRFELVTCALRKRRSHNSDVLHQTVRHYLTTSDTWRQSAGIRAYPANTLTIALLSLPAYALMSRHP